MSFARILVFALIALTVSVDARAQSAGNVPYIGLDAGLALSSADTETSDNDVPSACDIHYSTDNVGFRPVGNTTLAAATSFNMLDGEDGACEGSGDTWTNAFDTSMGPTVGVTAGISEIAGLPFRAEIEYLYRNNGFNERSRADFSGAKLVEFDPAFGGQLYGELGNVVSHNAFANLYYDFHLAGSSFTPYIGAGVGWSQTKFDMTSFFQRNKLADEPAPDNTGQPPGQPDPCDASSAGDCVLEALEGTVSYAHETHDDSTVAFQILLGGDYSLSENVSVGLKLRWAYFGDIEGERTQWDTLRSHASTIAPDVDGIDEALGRSNIVTYQSILKGNHILGAAVSLKYKFF